MDSILRTITLLVVLASLGCSSDSRSLRGSCGVVIDGKLLEEVEETDGIAVTITGSAGGQIVTVRERDTDLLQAVVLHGFGEIESTRLQAQAQILLQSFIGAAGFFFNADKGCTVDLGEREELVTGQIFLVDGTNLSEELLLRGLGTLDPGDECHSDLIRSCQEGLLIEDPFVNSRT